MILNVVKNVLDFTFLFFCCRRFPLTASLPATHLLCPSKTLLLPARDQRRFVLTLCLKTILHRNMLLQVFFGFSGDRNALLLPSGQNATSRDHNHRTDVKGHCGLCSSSWPEAGQSHNRCWGEDKPYAHIAPAV